MRNRIIFVLVVLVSVFSAVANADDTIYKFSQDASSYVTILPSAIPGTYIVKQLTSAFKGQQNFACFYLVEGQRPSSTDGVDQGLKGGRVVSFSCADK